MITLQLFLLLLLAVVSIFLATFEASFHLLKRLRLAQATLHDGKKAALAELYLNDPPRLLMPAHLGTYTSHVGMTVIITTLFLGRLTYWAPLAAFLAMMAYLLLFRASIPYGLVRQNAERTFLFLLPLFHLYAQALYPLIRRMRRRAAPEPNETGEARAGEPPPPVHESDVGRLVGALARFAMTPVREVMTPRPDVVAIAASASVADLRRMMRETKYSRVPVFGDSLDDIQGVVEVRDLLDFEGEDTSLVAGLARPAHIVPESKRIAELLREMQARQVTFAVAIDEYGGTAGLVTVEDIVEELVGEIKDEYDAEADPLAVEADGAVSVDGRLSVERLQEVLETPLQAGDGVDTVGGLVTSIFGRVPRAGERASYRGFEVEVTDAEYKRVNRVRFRRLGVPDPA
jgi:CBS domain containing-hemolysin-like protein